MFPEIFRKCLCLAISAGLLLQQSCTNPSYPSSTAELDELLLETEQLIFGIQEEIVLQQLTQKDWTETFKSDLQSLKQEISRLKRQSGTKGFNTFLESVRARPILGFHIPKLRDVPGYLDAAASQKKASLQRAELQKAETAVENTLNDEDLDQHALFAALMRSKDNLDDIKQLEKIQEEILQQVQKLNTGKINPKRVYEYQSAITEKILEEPVLFLVDEFGMDPAEAKRIYEEEIRPCVRTGNCSPQEVRRMLEKTATAHAAAKVTESTLRILSAIEESGDQAQEALRYNQLMQQIAQQRHKGQITDNEANQKLLQLQQQMESRVNKHYTGLKKKKDRAIAEQVRIQANLDRVNANLNAVNRQMENLSCHLCKTKGRARQVNLNYCADCEELEQSRLKLEAENQQLKEDKERVKMEIAKYTDLREEVAAVLTLGGLTALSLGATVLGGFLIAAAAILIISIFGLGKGKGKGKGEGKGKGPGEGGKNRPQHGTQKNGPGSTGPTGPMGPVTSPPVRGVPVVYRPQTILTPPIGNHRISENDLNVKIPAMKAKTGNDWSFIKGLGPYLILQHTESTPATGLFACLLPEDLGMICGANLDFRQLNGFLKDGSRFVSEMTQIPPDVVNFQERDLKKLVRSAIHELGETCTGKFEDCCQKEVKESIRSNPGRPAALQPGLPPDTDRTKQSIARREWEQKRDRGKSWDELPEFPENAGWEVDEKNHQRRLNPRNSGKYSIEYGGDQGNNAFVIYRYERGKYKPISRAPKPIHLQVINEAEQSPDYEFRRMKIICSVNFSGTDDLPVSITGFDDQGRGILYPLIEYKDKSTNKPIWILERVDSCSEVK